MVGRCRKAQFDHATVPHDGFALGQIDFNIVMFEEDLVQRMDRLVHGLLGNEEQSSAVRVVTQFEPLLWRRDQVQQLGRQALGRLNVDAQRTDAGTRSNCCDRDSIIMSQ